MRILATAALALTAAATPALAQDGSFQGPRAEIVGGWDHVEGADQNASGFVYGGAAGYDLQRGNAVFGVEGEITGSTAKKTENDVTLKAGRDFYAGVRAGYVILPSTLLYVKGGYTNARVIGETADVHVADNLDGFRLGAGLERSFGKFYGKVEYRYSNYSQDVERHQVLAGLGVRF
ncbi:porin family protein [Sphingomonas sp. dw_22]|uniref:outer membrane protein n=1 Tax=Sphingomonas sp. dw_22 TaxID=2721175 RepID=UPI001BD2A1C1|nr:porin family protein [Sphingomonas sp. dw_22]